MAIQWTDIDLSGGWLHVPAELRKGKRQDKTYKLHHDTIEALSAIRSPPRKIVFLWPYDANYIWLKYAELLKAAGLPHDRLSKFHRMRRSVASHFEKLGGNATLLLGHSNRSITEKSYLDPRIIQQKHASETLFRPDAKPCSEPCDCDELPKGENR